MAHPHSRIAYAPTQAGVGSGQAFFFFSGFECCSDKDRALRAFSVSNMGDDIAALRAAGYRVIFEMCATKDALVDALLSRHPDSEGTATAGFCWFGHGDPLGQVYAHDGSAFDASALPPEIAAKALCRLAVFGCCWVGLWQGSWRTSLGPNAKVHAWKRPVSAYVGQFDFFTPDDDSEQDFDDLLRNVLGAKSLGAGPFAETADLVRLDHDLAVWAEHNPLPIEVGRLSVGARVSAQQYGEEYIPAEITKIEGLRCEVRPIGVFLDQPFWVVAYQLRPDGAPKDAVLPGVPRLGAVAEVAGPDGVVRPARLVDRDAERYLARWDDAAQAPSWIVPDDIRSVNGVARRTVASFLAR